LVGADTAANVVATLVGCRHATQVACVALQIAPGIICSALLVQHTLTRIHASITARKHTSVLWQESLPRDTGQLTD